MQLHYMLSTLVFIHTQNEVIQKIQDKEKSIVKQLNQIEKTVK